MCGIATIIFKNELDLTPQLANKAIEALYSRGPNTQSFYKAGKALFVHTRLSIIDTNDDANQPFISNDKRYVLVFNGEIFNYKILREYLIKNYGVVFSTQSDTEVLLYLLIHENSNAINKLNGFFAFCFYDTLTNKVIVCRDRYGVKPLYVYESNEKIIIASEAKVFKALGIKYELNKNALSSYFFLNYLPFEQSLIQNVRKVKPAHYFTIDTRTLTCEEEQKYYTLTIKEQNISYPDAQIKFQQLLEKAVQDRLVSDVPLGAFLSGGLDSSVITTLAARNLTQLKTFSLGFKDHPYYDESKYARAVSKQLNTEHYEIQVTQNEMLQTVYKVLNYLDEPFADSSAINMYLLSEFTKQHVTVALSGDGADELLGGYNKHRALYKSNSNSVQNLVLKNSNRILQLLPNSRSSKWLDKFRKIKKYSNLLNAAPAARYLALAGIGDNNYINELFVERNKFDLNMDCDTSNFNSVLLNDMELVLAGDMLVKVDSMSMANSLEVRNPFLDVNVVDFLFSIPAAYKIDGQTQKKILLDSYKSILPKEVWNRPKHGFEVPLADWMKNDLYDLVFNQMLNKEFVEQQQLFNYTAIQKLKNQLFSNSSGDAPARLWALLVFQFWHKKHF